MKKSKNNGFYFLYGRLRPILRAAESRWTFLLIFCALSSGLLFEPSGMPSAEAGSRIAKPDAEAIDLDTQQSLEEIWLRYHKDNLCEDVDAAFALGGNRMSIMLVKKTLV